MVHNSPHHRKSIRLPGYDYSENGAYFITICVQDRRCLFGEVVDREMRLNDAGEMVGIWWGKMVERFSGVEMGAYVVMPNHFHGIIIINTVGAHIKIGDGGKTRRAGTRPAPTVGDIVGGFKSITTYEYIIGVKQNNWKPFRGRLWQRNYYEHIIRDEKDLDRVRQYILANPYNWEKDTLYP